MPDQCQNPRGNAVEHEGGSGGDVSPNFWDIQGGPDRVSGCLGESYEPLVKQLGVQLTNIGYRL
jgi:hypothetical protein